MKSVSPFQGAINALLLISSSFLMSAMPSAAAEEGNRNPKYLETRNDLGIVAYCSEKGLLPANSETFFKAFMDSFFGKLPTSGEADLHEKKGREGISYLQGEEQPVDELAAANNVKVSDVCDQYRNMILMGEIQATK